MRSIDEIPETAAVEASRQASAAQAYESPRFWSAYNTLHLHQSRHARVFAQRLVGCLGGAAGTAIPDKRLRVLIIGGGCGTVELPVLAEVASLLKDHTIEVHVVERSATAIGILRAILGNPTWTENPVERALAAADTLLSSSLDPIVSGPFNFYFYKLDLDCGFREEIGPFPSPWDLHFGDTRFGLIFAAFTLFHLTYWQAALCRILRLLQTGGILLHPRTSGDECIWERNLCREPERTPVTFEVFKRVYEHDSARAFAERPKINTASFPGQITGALQLLESIGIVQELRPTDDNPTAHSYRISRGTPTAATYLALLETRGFGLFRRLHDAIGSDEYDQILHNVASFARISDTADKDLNIELVWDVYKLIDASRTGFIAMLGGLDRRNASKKKTPFRSEFSLFQRRIAYQVSGFYADSNISANAMEADLQVNLLKESLVRRLQSERLLHPDATVGQIYVEKRVRTNRGESKRVPTIFTNPYFALEDPAGMAAHIDAHSRFLRLYRNRKHQDFSNIDILLDRLMPFLKKPCVFRYHAPKAGAQPVTFEEEADFFLIGFRPLADSIPTTPLRAVFPEPYRFLDYEKVPEPRADVPEAVRENAKALSTAMDPGGPVLFELRKALKYGEADGEYDRLLEAMAETIWGLNPLFEHNVVGDVLFIPACYSTMGGDPRHQNTEVAARDLLILSYNRELDSAEVAEEFERYNLIYDSIGLRRAQRDWATWVDGQLEHGRISKEIRNRVRLAIDPLSTRDDWMRLLHSSIWFAGAAHDANRPEAIDQLQQLRRRARELKIGPIFPSSVEGAAKPLFTSGKYSLRIGDLMAFLHMELNEQAESAIHLPFSPGIVWLRSLLELEQWLVSHKFLPAPGTAAFSILLHTRVEKPGVVAKYARLAFPFGTSLGEDTICSLQDGVNRAARLEIDEWKTRDDGDFRRVVASVLNGWFETYQCDEGDRKDRPFVWIDHAALYVGWKLGEAPESAAIVGDQPTVLIVDSRRDGWPDDLPPNIGLCSPTELAQLPPEQKFDLMFVHSATEQCINQSRDRCKIALFWFTREGTSVPTISVSTAFECHSLLLHVVPKHLVHAIRSLVAAMKNEPFPTALQTAMNEHKILAQSRRIAVKSP